MGTDLETTQGQPPAVQIRDTVATIKARVQMVQHVMRDVMKPDVHYGKIPGTPKPTLYKPGAEIIALAFQFAPRYLPEDLSVPDSVRYRTTCELWSRETGLFVGSGQGECSSDEEKYHWRKPVSDAEFESIAEDRRRIKFYREGQGKQVRIEPADIANTILKMAEKRAFIDAIRTASSCSDMFAQDLEDLPAEIRDGMSGEERQKKAAAPLGATGWKTLLSQAEGFGYTAESVISSAAVLGYEGPGEKMPRDIAKQLYRGMRDAPVEQADAEPEPTPDANREVHDLDPDLEPDDDPDGGQTVDSEADEEPIGPEEQAIRDLAQPEWVEGEATEEPEPAPAAKGNGRRGRRADNAALAKLVLQTKELEELGMLEEQWRKWMLQRFSTEHRSHLDPEQLSEAIDAMESSLAHWRAKKKGVAA